MVIHVVSFMVGIFKQIPPTCTGFQGCKFDEMGLQEITALSTVLRAQSG